MKVSIFFKNYQPLTTNQNNYPLIYADYVVLDLKRQWFVNEWVAIGGRMVSAMTPSFPKNF